MIDYIPHAAYYNPVPYLRTGSFFLFISLTCFIHLPVLPPFWLPPVCSLYMSLPLFCHVYSPVL